MSDNKELYRPQAQRDAEELERQENERRATLRHEPKVVEKIGIRITVYDENPETVLFALVDDWTQPFIPTDADQELLAKVSEDIFKDYEQQPADSPNLIRLARDLHRYMQEHHPNRYTGHVVLRRGKKSDEEGYGGYKYRYIAVE